VVSTDGGAHWKLAAGQPQFTVCEGATSGSPGFFNRATDPWVSFSSDGKVAYSISDSFNANGPGFGGASSGRPLPFPATYSTGRPCSAKMSHNCVSSVRSAGAGRS
jgi:hypothetical protein